MIIDFTLQNFRSVRDEQVFSLLALPQQQHLSQHVAYPPGAGLGVLRSAGIYGANAAGKSNILLAFEALRFMACASGNLKEDEPIPCYQPWQLGAQNRVAPVCFALEFIGLDGLRYVYALAYKRSAIVHESLDFYPGRQKANLFRRTEADNWQHIHFGSHYKGGIKRIPLFANNSYLAKAGDNAAACPQIRAVFHYLQQNLQCISPGSSKAASFADPALLERAAHFLQHIDTGISAMQHESALASALSGVSGVVQPGVNSMPAPEPRTGAQDALLFSHATDEGGVALFDERMESSGTRKLLRFLPLLMQAFAQGRVLIVDELERSLHPLIAELVLKLFNDPQVNLNGAQLIFSTHNTALMSPQLLRRDQIWFTEKRDGATSLFSLADFAKLDNRSPYQAWYGDGRFGALPAIDYAEVAKLLRPATPEGATGAESAEGAESVEDADGAGGAHAETS